MLTSVVTVRSDLDSLESVGRVRRVRGGAVPVGALRHEPPLEQAARENQAQKAAIAVSTIFTARSTPAQNPRGFASRTVAATGGPAVMVETSFAWT